MFLLCFDWDLETRPDPQVLATAQAELATAQAELMVPGSAGKETASPHSRNDFVVRGGKGEGAGLHQRAILDGRGSCFREYPIFFTEMCDPGI